MLTNDQTLIIIIFKLAQSVFREILRPLHRREPCAVGRQSVLGHPEDGRPGTNQKNLQRYESVHQSKFQSKQQVVVV